MEEWRSIKGYEGLYEVSNEGRIKSLPKYHYKNEKILKPTLNKKQGRYSVMLTDKNKKHRRIAVHRIVAIAFVENPNPKDYTEVNHIDENCRNNRAENLEWCDRWYNMHYNNLVDRIPRVTRKKIVGRNKDGLAIYQFKSLTEANSYGFCSRVLSNIINHPEKRKNGNMFKGYFWEEVKG